MCCLEFRFQNLTLSKSFGKNVPFPCEFAYPAHFLRFQNAPASCESSHGFEDLQSDSKQKSLTAMVITGLKQ